MELAPKIVASWFDTDYRGERLGFLLAPLTAPQWMNLASLAKRNADGDLPAGAMRYAVKDWRGFTKDGQEMKFRSVALESLLADVTTFDLMVEVGMEIIARNTLSIDEQKKSSLP